MLKKRISMIAVIFLVGCTSVTTVENGAQFTWDQDFYDYGTIYLDEMPETRMDIKFSNTGDAPLVLTNVKVCCGTQVKEWPKEPILPGEEEVIKIEIRLARRPQRISRAVIVTTNMENNQTFTFRIRGEVKERE